MWYSIGNIDQLPSPAFVVYPDRIRKNIETLVSSIDDVGRLRPHIKTHKSGAVCKMMMAAGISRFKCATIAEAEMLAVVGASDILLAYQPVGPTASRLSRLILNFPSVKWSCLIDDAGIAKHLSDTLRNNNLSIGVYLDMNVGMNRTGIVPERAPELAEKIKGLENLALAGVHLYDGHLRDVDFSERERKCDEAFAFAMDARERIERLLNRRLNVVAGGTPTFSIHRKRMDVECSPGTFIYWDKGYEAILPEQHYLHAGLVVSRVVSIPAENVICTDLGHKAIASENPLSNRVHFLNAPELEPIGHSEEHMVFRTANPYTVGDVLYGVPYHICPTVALHDVAQTVVNGKLGERWETLARKRSISI